MAQNEEDPGFQIGPGFELAAGRPGLYQAVLYQVVGQVRPAAKHPRKGAQMGKKGDEVALERGRRTLGVGNHARRLFLKWRVWMGRRAGGRKRPPGSAQIFGYFLTAGSTFGSSAFTAGAAAGVTAGIGAVATSAVAAVVLVCVMLESFLLAAIGAAVSHIST